nr:PREDICTED: phospholipase A2 inhibitor and Ly6/PLAUR domain-containing protein isoform X2 [Anolis carolinensis]|eukprot:XP_016850277.1 PREDICTED: phospholipase A2 inhibitor and Ly6/PLAUR domain-containing protein isoform X2 [Anolis carolinensis]
MISCECNSGDNLCSKDGSCIIEKGDCIAIAFNNTLDGKDIKKVYLGCQPKSVSFDQCHEENIFITAGKDVYLNSQAKCCHGKDKCNNDLKLVTKESDKTSEMKCPSCFALSPESCNATKTNCFKDQNRCINVTGKLMNGWAKWNATQLQIFQSFLKTPESPPTLPGHGTGFEVSPAFLSV